MSVKASRRGRTANVHGQFASKSAAADWEPSFAPVLAILGKPTNVTTSPQLAEDLIKEFKFFDLLQKSTEQVLISTCALQLLCTRWLSISILLPR